MPEPPEDIPSDELDQFYEDTAIGQEFHEQLALGAAISGVAAQRKPVDKLLRRLSDFTDGMTEIENIHIYGLSLSEVDLPYIQYLASKNQTAFWEFSDYKKGNEQTIKTFCEVNGIKNYNIIELEDIMQVRQLCIPFDKN